MCCRQLRQAGAKAEAPAAAPGVDLQAALPPPKKKWKFLQARGLCGGFGRGCNCLKRCACLLQKYWHKGAFFQGEDEDGEAVLGDIMRRDYDAPTGEDKFDRQMLPKVMQVGVVQHGVSFWAGAGISHPNKLHPSSTWWSSNLLCSTPRSCHRSITCALPRPLFSLLRQVRNFGRRGRTKWTHLLAEDTSMQAADPANPAASRLPRERQPQDVFDKPRTTRT